MVSHKTNDNIAKRDLKLLQLEEEIKKKKEFLLKKRKELEKKEKLNLYLAKVKEDYDNYYEEELEKKKRELNAMSILNDYVIYLENQNHLVSNQLIVAKHDKKHISKEINKIKKELDKLTDINS
jgi:uncharacterized protein (DUF3084 family)